MKLDFQLQKNDKERSSKKRCNIFEEQIRRLVSSYFVNNILKLDPRLAGVTITRVKTTKDLKQADIYISISNTDIRKDSYISSEPLESDLEKNINSNEKDYQRKVERQESAEGNIHILTLYSGVKFMNTHKKGIRYLSLRIFSLEGVLKLTFYLKFQIGIYLLKIQVI